MTATLEVKGSISPLSGTRRFDDSCGTVYARLLPASKRPKPASV